METKKEEYCTGCRNNCPLSNPKCDFATSPEMQKKRAQDARREQDICKMCDRRCTMDDLGCSLGRTIYGIKKRDVNG